MVEGWFTYFNATGVSFLQFLLAKKHDKLKSLNDEIIAVKNKLGPFKEQDLYKQKSDQLRLFLEKEDHDQKIKKKKKYNQDLADYSNKVIFKWQIKVDDPMEGDEAGAYSTTAPPQPLPSSSSVVPPPSTSYNRGPNEHRGQATRTNQRGYISDSPKTNNQNRKNNQNKINSNNGGNYFHQQVVSRSSYTGGGVSYPL